MRRRWTAHRMSERWRPRALEDPLSVDDMCPRAYHTAFFSTRRVSAVTGAFPACRADVVSGLGV